MTTVTSKSGRKFEVREDPYGKNNHYYYRVFYGGIYLTTTGERGPKGESSTSLEIAIERAEKRVEVLGINISE